MNGEVVGLLQQQLELQKALLEKQTSVSLSWDNLPLGFPSQGVGQAPEIDVPKTAADMVRAHLKAHPEDAKLPVRKLAEKLNVGKSTVDRVLKE